MVSQLPLLYALTIEEWTVTHLISFNFIVKGNIGNNIFNALTTEQWHSFWDIKKGKWGRSLWDWGSMQVTEITLKLDNNNNNNNKSNAITWDEKFMNGSSSVDESSFSLVTNLGYKLVKAANLDWPPYICEPATNIWVLRLKPRAASKSIASSGVKGHRPSDLSSAGEGNLHRFKYFD